VIDRSRCMAPRDDASFGGPRCQEPATHKSIMGRCCARHAEALRESLRSPNTLGNIFAGRRARTEEEIARMVVELQ
jgi:hypothetical protein